jgi:chromosome segregation ATPase
MPDRFQPTSHHDMCASEEGEYVDWQDWLMEYNSRIAAQARAAELESKLGDCSSQRYEAIKKVDELGREVDHLQSRLSSCQIMLAQREGEIGDATVRLGEEANRRIAAESRLNGLRIAIREYCEHILDNEVDAVPRSYADAFLLILDNEEPPK